MYQDETLKCIDCGQEFIFTARDQEVFEERGFTKKPVRCQRCRIARRDEHNKGASRGNGVLFDAVCSQCGAPTKVPFKPTENKRVYCRECYKKKG